MAPLQVCVTVAVGMLLCGCNESTSTQHSELPTVAEPTSKSSTDVNQPLGKAASITSIAELDQLLTPLIRYYFPGAKIQVSTTKYAAKHGTMDFTVHARSMDGEVLRNTYVEEGPNYRGFTLQIGLNEGPYQGQAGIPQNLHEIYWTTFLDAAPVSGHDKHLMTQFSFGSRLNEDFKEAVLNALPKSRR
jgi:hypothetical protein